MGAPAAKPIPAALFVCRPWRLDSRVQAGMTAPSIFRASPATCARLTDCGRGGGGGRRALRREAPSFPQAFKRESRVFFRFLAGAIKDSGFRIGEEYSRYASLFLYRTE